jgi:hypothetical protein
MISYIKVSQILSIEQQLDKDLAQWMWNSHCWTKMDEYGRMQCIWCGYVPPSPNVLSRETINICPKNPEILKLLKEYHNKRK